MDEDDDLIVVVVDDKGGQNHEIYLDSDVNIKVEPAEMAEIDEAQQKEILQMISSGCGYIQSEPIENEQTLNEDELDVEYLPEELSSDDFDEEFDDDDDDEEDTFPKSKAGFKKQKPKEKRNWLKNNSASWVSYVNHIRIDNPDVQDNDEAMAKLIVEQMKTVKPPNPDPSWYTHLGVEKFRCNVCMTIKITAMEVIRHYLYQHGPRYLVCLACGADFRSTTNLYKHEKRCQAPDAKLVLKARALYIGNKARCGPKSREDLKRFKCLLCPAAYMAKTSLIAHERLHRAERPFRCDYCSRSYTCKAVLAKHRLIHEGGQFICDYCNRCFTYKTALASHIYSHSEVPRFPCAECPRRFTYKAALQLHVHSKHRHLPPPCACKICPKRFGRMWALKDHMRKAHGLLLMTRRMFFKQLPTMSETCIKEARVVLRSEVPILHPSDINLDLEPVSNRSQPQDARPQRYYVKQEATETFLDEKSGQIVGDYPEIHISEIDDSNNGTKVEIKNEMIELQEELENVDSNEENYLRIVLLDDSVVDYNELVKNYHLTGNKNSNVVVIENGKVKDLTDEELKTYEESINGIQL